MPQAMLTAGTAAVSRFLLSAMWSLPWLMSMDVRCRSHVNFHHGRDGLRLPDSSPVPWQAGRSQDAIGVEDNERRARPHSTP